MAIFYKKVMLSLNDLQGKDPEEIIELILAKVKEHYDEKEAQLGEEQMREFEKVIVLACC